VLPCVPTAVTLALHETLEDDAKLAVALVAESGEIDVMESGLVPVQHWIESRLFAVVRLSEVRSIASEVVGPAAEADALAPLLRKWIHHPFRALGECPLDREQQDTRRNDCFHLQ